MKARYLVCLALVALGAYACSSSDPAPSAPADVTTPPPSSTSSTSSSTSSSGSSTTAQTVGTAGGSVAVTGLDLAIPAGALPKDTPITVTTEGAVPAEYTGLSPLYTFGPDGTVFEKPVTVTFALSKSGSEPTVYWSNAAGGYDELPTTVTDTGVTASVAHFSHGFVAEKKKKIDDAGAASDAGASDDAGPSDSGTSSDASSDAGQSDSGASSDAGVNGITVTVDGTITTFGTNASVTMNGGPIVVADDNATPTHWSLVLQMTTVPQQACSVNGATAMIYTHYTANVIDAVYSSKVAQSTCILLLTHSPAAAGEHATGKIMSSTLNEQSGPTTPTSHTFASGTFDVIY